ncbi:MAG TPA: branched-chain-amino-acid transaminase [Firmicutes bacterium]|nr:branched-chain-amino-acid transaminase [Bacillota bacterium]
MMGFINGKLVPEKEATISVFDHGFLYGDGVFEGIRAYNGRVFRLTQHIRRLFESAKHILLPIPYSQEEMEMAVIKTVRENNLKDAYIRVVVSRGVGDLGLDPHGCRQSQVIIIADKINLYSQEMYRQGLKVVTVPTRRNICDALDPKIKSLNYLNNILVKIEANQAGVMEALMLDRNGYVTEGSGDNVFIYRRGVLKTPPAYLGILEGVTREVVIELARQEKIPVQEVPFTRHDVYVSEECFLTGTAAEVIPVVEVDGREIGDGSPGPVAERLITRFREIVLNEGAEIY